MKCDRTIQVMQEYADGLLSPVVAIELEDHVADCPRCSEELRVLLRMCQSISSLPEVEPGFDVVGAVRERIADLPRESFAWSVLPRRERPRVWVLAAILWVGLVAAGLSNYWAQASVVGSKVAGGLAGAGHWAWGHISASIGELLSALAPVGRAGHSAAADFLAGAQTSQIFAYIAGFLLACFLIIAADRLKKLRTAAGTIQIIG